MQKPDVSAIDEGILQRHETMYDAYFEDLPLIPKDQFCEISFDALEQDPVGAIHKIYRLLSLEGYDTFEPNLKSYVESLSGYQKNEFSELDEATRKIVARRWKRSFKTWGYPVD